MKIKPNITNKDAFIDELWQKLVNDGLYAGSKNDIYDFLIYLFNKFDSAHFFGTNSNEQNERLLKISTTKAKTAKKEHIGQIYER